MLSVCQAEVDHVKLLHVLLSLTLARRASAAQALPPRIAMECKPRGSKSFRSRRAETSRGAGSHSGGGPKPKAELPELAALQTLPPGASDAELQQASNAHAAD